MERRADPALQRVGPEVALHHEPRVAALVESRDPPFQQPVELVLADADGRIRADRAERHVRGNIVGQRCVDIGEPESSRVAADEIQGALVHVDGPHCRMGRGEGHRDRDRTPTAPEVEKVAAGRNRRRVGEEHCSAGVETVRAEDTTGGGELELSTCERYADLTKVLGACRGRSEVVIGPHRASVPDSAG